jgi:hypothetical protein
MKMKKPVSASIKGWFDGRFENSHITRHPDNVTQTVSISYHFQWFWQFNL